MQQPPQMQQISFIEKLKASVKRYGTDPIPVEFNPPQWNGKEPPSAFIYYEKPIYLCAPHLNFPGIAIPCGSANCCGVYVEKGWGDQRILYGLSTSINLVQYRYHCNNKHCSNFSSSVCTETIVKSQRCPQFVRQHYEKYYYTTLKAGVTGELKSYILNDAMTAKSFEDIEFGIKAFQRERYLSHRASYIAAIEWYCHISNRTIDTFPEFTTMDDPNGYDAKIPSNDYILDLFKGRSNIV